MPHQVPPAIAFAPLFMERVWGGARLARRYGKALPAGAVIGESWELVDREDAQSVVLDGPLRGTTLNALWSERDRREEIFGARGAASEEPRFPVLLKLLDATQTLSVQVHPPAEIAAQLGGEPKNEMWFLLDTEPGAHIYAGLRASATRDAFAAALLDGEDVSLLLHRLDVEPGDAIYIPSGRVHAIGAGCLIAEVQQNSDTTYRVFDFNRPGLDGRPRELHVEQSMRCIDFDDVEPQLAEPDFEQLVATPFFEVDCWQLDAPRAAAPDGECAIVLGLSGELDAGTGRFGPGEMRLVRPGCELRPVGDDGAELLRILLPASQ